VRLSGRRNRIYVRTNRYVHALYLSRCIVTSGIGNSRSERRKIPSKPFSNTNNRRG